jgi:hypothetical protein
MEAPVGLEEVHNIHNEEDLSVEVGIGGIAAGAGQADQSGSAVQGRAGKGKVAHELSNAPPAGRLPQVRLEVRAGVLCCHNGSLGRRQQSLNGSHIARGIEVL